MASICIVRVCPSICWSAPPATPSAVEGSADRRLTGYGHPERSHRSEARGEDARPPVIPSEAAGARYERRPRPPRHPERSDRSEARAEGAQIEGSASTPTRSRLSHRSLDFVRFVRSSLRSLRSG